MTQTREAASAAATSTTTTAVTPNLFTFSGRRDDTQVTFSTTSITGQPQFSYHDDTRDVSATGDEITVERTVLGTLVTVTLETVPDLHTVTATLVLPDLGGLSGPVTHFGTFLVLTENRTSIGGPALVSGALQRYTLVKGRGTAQEVAF
jgi:hypothetical protein